MIRRFIAVSKVRCFNKNESHYICRTILRTDDIKCIKQVAIIKNLTKTRGFHSNIVSNILNKIGMLDKKYLRLQIYPFSLSYTSKLPVQF